MKGMAMKTMTENLGPVTVGVDTHRDDHVAAVLDAQGRLLGTESFPASDVGYQELTEWAAGFGPIEIAGIEGTGSWGTGLARYVTRHGIDVREVNRPNRQHRRRHGKSDTADAVAAAKAVQCGDASGQPRGNHNMIEGLRAIRVAHRSSCKARTQGINQLHALVATAPDTLRNQLRSLNATKLASKAARFRPCTTSLDAADVTKIAMRSIAQRVEELTREIAELETHRDRLVSACAPPELLAEFGIGPETATNLLIAFGDNPQRIHSEAAFAALCGVSPIDCSSGRHQRHRLNRGGDRQANNALWRITLVRLAGHQRTRDYMARSIANGKTKKETIRKIKRYIARRIWRIFNSHPPQLAS